jgi:signal peptidase
MDYGSHVLETCCDLVVDVANASGVVHLRVAGSSMIPILWPGDLVFVRPCDFSQLEPGMVIVFRQNERLVIHRIIRWEHGAVVTRGDARARLDGPVDREDVIGRVDEVLRNGKPVDLNGSPRQTFTASMLRRSEVYTRLYLRCSSMLRRLTYSTAAGPQ